MFLNNRWKLVWFLSFGGFIYAQEPMESQIDSTKVNELEEVIVTATRTKRQLSSVPMPVILINKKQIQKSGSVRLRDILLEQTGITLVKDVGNSEGVQLQGISADYTLIMIDGVPIVGRTAGNIDLNRITVNNIKQIEVVKGPTSSLYGSEAMGGVINIITEKPTKEQLKGSLQLLTRGGARNEFDANGEFSFRKKNLGLIAGLNLNSSGGFDLVPQTTAPTVFPHQNITGNLQVMYDFNSTWKIDVASRFFEQKQYVNSVINKQKDWNVNAKVTQAIHNNWNVLYTFYGTRFNTESTLNGETSLFNRSLFRPEVRSTVNLSNRESIVVGLGGNIDGLDRTSINGAKEFRAWYAYGQYDFFATEKLNVVLGARYEGSSSYQSAFSPKVSASYEVFDDFIVKASAGYGFKIPDFRQLFFDFRNITHGYIVLGTHTLHNLYGNQVDLSRVEKQLKPESSKGYNVGFRWKPIQAVTVNVNAFRNDIQDLIDTFDTRIDPTAIGLPTGTRTFSYRNINRVFTQGIEVDMNVKINKNIQLFGGYQYLDTGNKDDIARIEQGLFYRDANGVSQRLQKSSYFGLVNRSKHMWNAKLFYENFAHDFSVNARGIYRSKFAPFDSNDNAVIDEFDNFVKPNFQLNIAVNKTLYNWIDFQIGVDNVLNNTGAENGKLFNYRRTDGTVIPNENYLLLGRNYYGRVRFNF